MSKTQEELEKELKNAKDELDKRLKDDQKMQEDFKKTLEFHKGEITKLQKELGESKLTIAKLEEKNKNDLREMSGLNESIEDLNTRIARLESYKLNGDGANLEKEKMGLSKELKETKVQIAELQERNKKLSTEVGVYQYVEYSLNYKAIVSYMFLMASFIKLKEKLQDPKFHKKFQEIIGPKLPEMNKLVSKDIMLKILSIFDKLSPPVKTMSPLIALMIVGFINGKLFKNDMGMNKSKNPELYEAANKGKSILDKIDKNFFTGSLKKARLSSALVKEIKK